MPTTRSRWRRRASRRERPRRSPCRGPQGHRRAAVAAEAEVASTLQAATDKLNGRGDAVSGSCRPGGDAVGHPGQPDPRRRADHSPRRDGGGRTECRSSSGSWSALRSSSGCWCKFVVPPVRKLMADQQESVRKQLEDAAAAAARPTEADQAHAKALEARQGRGEAGHRRGTVGRRADRRATAQPGRRRAERMKTTGRTAGRLMRAQLIRELRSGAWRRSRAARQANWSRDYVSDPHAAVGHRRPVPRRARRHGAVVRRGRVRRPCEVAFRQPTGSGAACRTGSAKWRGTLTTTGLGHAGR